MGGFLARYSTGSIWDRRGLAAFALTPIAPALIAAVLASILIEASIKSAIQSAILVAYISYPHMLVLGLPCAYILNIYRKISFATVALSSFLIGAVPETVYHIYSILHPENGTNPVFTVADMPRTMALALIFGGFGLSAGIAWWFIALFRKPMPQSVQ